MTEKYFQVTCDVCGEIEWSQANEPLRELKSDFCRNWKFRGKLAMCHKCCTDGRRWREAVLHVLT